MADAPLDRGQQPLPTLQHLPQDPSWLQFLPRGSIIEATSGHASSYSSQLGKVDVRLAGGQIASYCLKLTRGELGRDMTESEYESMKMLHSFGPEITPKPIGWGTFQSDSDIHFLLSDFLDLGDETPESVNFCMRVAEMHRKSMVCSPGKFGFHVTTFNGIVPQYVEWTDSWEEFFVRALQSAFALEEAAHGTTTEITDRLPALYTKVCPRLLRPLESEGRVITPCLVHGDLWEGNIGVHKDTGKPYIFDASAFWGHNEYDLHCWRVIHHKLDSLVVEYFKHMPISQPVDDWSDHNLLYSLRQSLHASIIYTKTDRFRIGLIDTLKYLVNKYPGGYEGSENT